VIVLGREIGGWIGVLRHSGSGPLLNDRFIE
jgi:hypothetical protein